ncbi:hypothetical protein C8R43DRAFT_1235252 [Mycena crocata]|nr:hypothetical protein C8R43DRAFT_1235252 [Mycena crocata]
MIGDIRLRKSAPDPARDSLPETRPHLQPAPLLDVGGWLESQLSQLSLHRRRTENIPWRRHLQATAALPPRPSGARTIFTLRMKPRPTSLKIERAPRHKRKLCVSQPMRLEVDGNWIMMSKLPPSPHAILSTPTGLSVLAASALSSLHHAAPRQSSHRTLRPGLLRPRLPRFASFSPLDTPHLSVDAFNRRPHPLYAPHAAPPRPTLVQVLAQISCTPELPQIGFGLRYIKEHPLPSIVSCVLAAPALSTLHHTTLAPRSRFALSPTASSSISSSEFGLPIYSSVYAPAFKVRRLELNPDLPDTCDDNSLLPTNQNSVPSAPIVTSNASDPTLDSDFKCTAWAGFALVPHVATTEQGPSIRFDSQQGSRIPDRDPGCA